MITEKAKEITNKIYRAYGSDSGVLFGIHQGLRASVEGIVQTVIDDVANTCPFCGEGDFDKVGLKSHLNHGDCEVFEKLENIVRTF
jgi:hypothetical protein